MQYVVPPPGTSAAFYHNWELFAEFLQKHDVELRQKRKGTFDKLYNDAVAVFGNSIPSKESLRTVVCFYRKFNNIQRIYQPNKQYTPKNIAPKDLPKFATPIPADMKSDPVPSS